MSGHGGRGRGGGGRGRGRGGGGGGGGGGRGEYYKNKYGRRNDSSSSAHHEPARAPGNREVLGPNETDALLRRIDGKSYGFYKDLLQYELRLPLGGGGGASYCVLFDHVQGDPYAAPSHLRVRLPLSTTGFPGELYTDTQRRVAFCDFLHRLVHAEIKELNADVPQMSRSWGGAKGGDLSIAKPSAFVLARSCLVVPRDLSRVELRFALGLPAAGRSIQGGFARAVLRETVQRVLSGALFRRFDAAAARRHVQSAEDQRALRAALAARGLFAFVGDGSVLPRASGASQRPMAGAVPFASPPGLRVEIELPHAGRVLGMGVPKGVTVIVGGGFHGKSTLLEALQHGVYDKVPGDGRELVACAAGAVKVRAEDGRGVSGVAIAPFIARLPLGKDTAAFDTADASGSTSQAAAIVEALEAGAEGLLIDEDSSATNFMIRDARMQLLVHKEFEPITPLVFKVRQLYEELGVSTVLVMGGSSDYFEVADTVVMMKSYAALDATAEVRALCRANPNAMQPEGGERFGALRRRTVADARSLGGQAGKVRVRSLHEVQWPTPGREEDEEAVLDLHGLPQLVDRAQTAFIADFIRHVTQRRDVQTRPLVDIVREMLAEMEQEESIDAASMRGHPEGSHALARIFEIMAAMNRIRGLQMK